MNNVDKCRSMRFNTDQVKTYTNDDLWGIYAAFIGIDLYWEELIFIEENWSLLIGNDLYWATLGSIPEIWSLLIRIDRHRGFNPACPVLELVILVLTVDATMGSVCSPPHFWCPVHLNVLNNQMICVQTLKEYHRNILLHMVLKSSVPLLVLFLTRSSIYKVRGVWMLSLESTWFIQKAHIEWLQEALYPNIQWGCGVLWSFTCPLPCIQHLTRHSSGAATRTQLTSVANVPGLSCGS